jgi:hypothetical protein
MLTSMLKYCISLNIMQVPPQYILLLTKEGLPFFQVFKNKHEDDDYEEF